MKWGRDSDGNLVLGDRFLESSEVLGLQLLLHLVELFLRQQAGLSLAQTLQDHHQSQQPHQHHRDLVRHPLNYLQLLP